MKVSRREFLKLVGAAAAGAVVPKVQPPEIVEKEKWHHVALDWSEDGSKRYYWDGGEVTREEFLDLNRHTFDVVIGNPPWQPEPTEYDSDMYFPISEGVCFESWTDPWNGDERHVQLEWLDHGLHTVYLADGQYLGQSLSKGVDPFDHVRSIWVAGLAAVGMILRDRT